MTQKRIGIACTMFSTWDSFQSKSGAGELSISIKAIAFPPSSSLPSWKVAILTPASPNIDPNAPTVNEIEYRNTGVTLQVTPRVNAGGLVTMDLDQEVSDAISTTSSTLNAPTIQQRKITSTVAVQSGETIVLGGLIRNTATEGESGIPYLRNIPVFGKLFSQTNDSKKRTELIVLITPRAVGDDNDAREVTREYSERMKSFDPPSKSGVRY